MRGERSPMDIPTPIFIFGLLLCMKRDAPIAHLDALRLYLTFVRVSPGGVTRRSILRLGGKGSESIADA